jgi:hypothetical protein
MEVVRFFQKMLDKAQDKYIIVEEAPGYYHYHIGLESSFTKSLCGKDITMMPTMIPLDTWGYRGELRERYCDKCKELYDRGGKKG